jgi:Phospholipase_D-nuclease N-terminal/Short C-terminal domain
MPCLESRFSGCKGLVSYLQRARAGARLARQVFLASDYPFLDILWTMFIFFLFIIWIWILITVFADVFRRKDIGGGMKAIWIIFVILLPYLGVLVYLIANHDGMADRNVSAIQAQQEQMDAYVKSVAGSGGAAAEIEKAKGLLDSGAITQAEFDSIKSKALAT